MISAVPPKFRSGKAARKSPANARTASRPRSGACSEYSNRMSGAASSSMTAGLKSLPQNSANHRPTTALFSSIDMSPSLPVRELSAPSEGAPSRRTPGPPREMAAGFLTGQPACGGLPEARREGMPRLRGPCVLDLEQGALPVQAACVAGQLACAADHAVAGDHDAQRVAAHCGTDVPRIRPGRQCAREIAVGGRLPVGDAGYQLPDPPVEVGAVDLHGQLERTPVPAEVFAELA